jgi:proline dehydrogenase
LCLQAYLHRTKDDLASLLPLGASIRLVKGAYSESPEVAFPRKADVDENYFALAAEMLRAKKEQPAMRAALGTHDILLLQRISEFAASAGLAKSDVEVQMLYGIQSGEQERLAREGYTSRVLVAYGNHWYAWFVRRLAERPANLWFVARNLF